jgi:transposase
MLVGMKAYSLDLRTRVVDAIDNGMPRTQAVGVFQVSLGSLKRWLRQRQSSDSLAPKRRPGQSATITEAQNAFLRFQLEQFPDATLSEHAERWNADHGTTLSHWTLGRAIRRLGWSRKKRV